MKSIEKIKEKQEGRESWEELTIFIIDRWSINCAFLLHPSPFYTSIFPLPFHSQSMFHPKLTIFLTNLFPNRQKNMKLTLMTFWTEGMKYNEVFSSLPTGFHQKCFWVKVNSKQVYSLFCIQHFPLSFEMSVSALEFSLLLLHLLPPPHPQPFLLANANNLMTLIIDANYSG